MKAPSADQAGSWAWRPGAAGTSSRSSPPSARATRIASPLAGSGRMICDPLPSADQRRPPERRTRSRGGPPSGAGISQVPRSAVRRAGWTGVHGDRAAVGRDLGAADRRVALHLEAAAGRQVHARPAAHELHPQVGAALVGGEVRDELAVARDRRARLAARASGERQHERLGASEWPAQRVARGETPRALRARTAASHGRRDARNARRRRPTAATPDAGGRRAQREREVARRLEALRLLLGEAALDDRGRAPAGTSGRERGEARQVVAQHRGDQVLGRVARERAPARQALVEDAAEREDVAARVDGLAAGLLGRQVAERPEHDAGPRRRRERRRLGRRRDRAAGPWRGRSPGSSGDRRGSGTGSRA